MVGFSIFSKRIEYAISWFSHIISSFSVWCDYCGICTTNLLLQMLYGINTSEAVVYGEQIIYVSRLPYKFIMAILSKKLSFSLFDCFNVRLIFDHSFYNYHAYSDNFTLFSPI